jgi:hypothetical protein
MKPDAAYIISRLWPHMGITVKQIGLTAGVRPTGVSAIAKKLKLPRRSSLRYPHRPRPGKAWRIG